VIGELGDAARAFSNASPAPVWQLNAYFLETLIQSSRHPAWCGSPWERALGSNLADVLPTIQEELSRTPVSLVDIGLNDAGSRPLLAGAGDAPAHSAPAFLPRDRAVHLAQAALTVAWTLARSDLVATSIAFGVSRSQAREISALGCHRIGELSEKLLGAVRPRWLSQPRLWQRLLGSSDRSISSQYPPRPVRILQRQFADLIPATSATYLLYDSRP
jgi:hypothetical protein